MVRNRILVVTGMHRSGTSVVTQWLNRCGLQVGDNLMGAAAGNDDGHYEDVDFLRAHEAILKSRRLPDKGYTDAIKQLTEEETDRLRDIVYYKNCFHQQWGWKDPRTCLFLDTYRQLLPDAFYFVVLRNCPSVVTSLIIRMRHYEEKEHASLTGISKFIWTHFSKKRLTKTLLKKHSQHYLQVWINYNEAILQHLQQLRRNSYLVTDYSSLYDNDKTVFEQLTKRWGFTLHFCPFREVYKENLLHAAFNIDPYIKDKQLLSRAAAVETALRRLSLQERTPVTLHAV